MICDCPKTYGTTLDPEGNPYPRGKCLCPATDAEQREEAVRRMTRALHDRGACRVQHWESEKCDMSDCGAAWFLRQAVEAGIDWAYDPAHEAAAEQRGYERGKVEECDVWRGILGYELGVAGEPLGISPAGGADIAMHVELQLEWARDDERERLWRFVSQLVCRSCTADTCACTEIREAFGKESAG